MKQSIKKTNQSAKILENYAKFANSTQTTIFYIQEMFQSILITSTKPQITQDCLVFLSF